MMIVGEEEGRITCFGDPLSAAMRAHAVETISNKHQRGAIEARAALLGDA